MNIERIKDHYSTIYVTVVSVFLGLALEDFISIFRTIENPGLYEWIGAIFIIHLVLNTWIAFSSLAISVRLIPVPMDAINVFGLMIGQFTLNTFILHPPFLLFYIISFYNLATAMVVYYNAYRASQDRESQIAPSQYRSLIYLNILISIVTAIMGLILHNEMVNQLTTNIIICSILLFPFLWIVLFWKIWRNSILDHH